MVLKSEVVDKLKEFLSEVAVAGHSVRVLTVYARSVAYALYCN